MLRRPILLLAVLAALAAPGALALPVRAAEPADLASPHAPPRLAQRIRALGAGFEGHVGIAVLDLRDGWSTAWNGEGSFPQESVAKLWTVIAALDAVDTGRLRLDEELTLTRADLSVFHEPIAARIGRHGYRTTIAGLIADAIVDSDNAANDILVRRLGGTEAVQEAVRRKGLVGITAGVQQRELQARVAGLAWTPALDGDERLEAARARLDPSARGAAMRRYLEAPYDGAAPLAIVRALGELHAGRLLSPASTGRLLRLMHAMVHGEQRLNGGLARGWTISHKTGTGQRLGRLQVGTNDVGILTAPDGHAYAVAVLVGSTNQPLALRERLMRQVAAAVVRQWRATGEPDR